MRRTLIVSLLVLASLLMMTGPVAAITDGEPDGNGHPYVGLMVAQDAMARPCGAAAAR